MALKTPFTKPGVPIPDVAGAGIVSRGTDPNVTLDGSSALQTAFNKAICPTPGGEETRNSVSKLPKTPNRFEPSGTPPEPPSLKDRHPGTVG